MALGLQDLLNLPSWRAYDVDDEGRILAGYDGSGSIQLVELAPDGAATPLTALAGPCSGRYLPGERAVVVVHDVDGDERTQLSLLRVDEPRAAPVGVEGLVPLVRDERYIHTLIDVGPGRVVYSTNRRNGVDFDVILRSTVDGGETVAYDGGGNVQQVAVAPDRSDGVLALVGERPMSEQLLAFAAGGPVRALTAADEHAQHNGVQWRPDGRTLIVNGNPGREYVAVLQLDPASGGWAEIVADPEHDVRGFLSPDGTTLLACTNVDGATRLALHDSATGERLRTIDLPEDGWGAGYPAPDPVWSRDSLRIVLSFTGPTTPGDVLRIDAATGAVEVVASSTVALKGAVLTTPVSHRVPTPDGERIPCFVYRAGSPQDPALAGSAVLIIHGGPEAQAVRSFNPVIQALAAAGHTVLVPNVRGSDGYGKRWVSLDDVRLRLDSVADLAALHAYLPQLGLDQERAALYGGSYGGYMVLAGVAFQPDLWAAGVDIVGMSCLVTFLENTSSYRRAGREREYGSLVGDRDFLERASPLGRVGDIRAPLFVIHGANDPRVPLSEAEQLVAAVTANGVPCELHVYSDEGHGLARRSNRLDAYPRALAFLAEYLRAA